MVSAAAASLLRKLMPSVRVAVIDEELTCASVGISFHVVDKYVGQVHVS